MNAKRLTREIVVDPRVPGWHSTGLYAAPGEIVQVVIPHWVTGRGLRLRIGAHSDTLWELDAWQRWPSISWKTELRDAVTRFASPFGGLIYFVVPEDCKLGTFSVQITNAVNAPYYVLGKTTVNQWRDSLYSSPAPWAELECSGVILTVPTEAARRVGNPEALMLFWNRVIQAQDELAAWNAGDRKRPERLVTDQQISAGYMHAGYPFMTHMDAASVVVDKMWMCSGKQPTWGLFHELGHNHQSDDWTFDGAGEVTCNLFTRYVLEKVCNIPLERQEFRDDSVRDAVRKHLRTGGSFSTWKNEPFLALMMYEQLQVGFSWDSFKEVFAIYRDLPRWQRPKNDDEKRDQWMVRFSRSVGKNLGPFFQAWAVPTSKEARASIADLPEWKPKGFPTKSKDKAAQ